MIIEINSSLIFQLPYSEDFPNPILGLAACAPEEKIISLPASSDHTFVPVTFPAGPPSSASVSPEALYRRPLLVQVTPPCMPRPWALASSAPPAPPVSRCMLPHSGSEFGNTLDALALNVTRRAELRIGVFVVLFLSCIHPGLNILVHTTLLC